MRDEGVGAGAPAPVPREVVMTEMVDAFCRLEEQLKGALPALLKQMDAMDGEGDRAAAAKEAA